MATIVYGGGGNGGISYSTVEKEIGTWIDGRKVYRRVFDNGSAEPVSGNHNITKTVQDIDILIDANFLFYSKTTNRWETNWNGILNRYLDGNTLGIGISKTPAYSSSYIIATYVKKK